MINFKIIKRFSLIRSSLILILFISIIHAASPMVLAYDIPYSNKSVEIPLWGVVNVKIDWGDGTHKEAVTTAGKISHTYAEPGSYKIRITGKADHFGAEEREGIEYLSALDSWGELNMTSLNAAFQNAGKLTSVPATFPKTVTNAECMFYGAGTFNSDISDWDVSNVTTMEGMFAGTKVFNSDISSWNVSNVENMSFMFFATNLFDQDISGWDVSNVKTMEAMFAHCKSFKQDIGEWDVSNVTSMSLMFADNQIFNRDIEKWNVSKVTSMNSMFKNNTIFNRDIGDWDVSNVTDLVGMFKNATSFDQDLGDWDVSEVKHMDDMFYNVTLSVTNYESLLINWSSLLLNENVQFSGGDSKYVSQRSAKARDILIDTYKWEIEDGGTGTLLSE